MGLGGFPTLREGPFPSSFMRQLITTWSLVHYISQISSQSTATAPGLRPKRLRGSVHSINRDNSKEPCRENRKQHSALGNRYVCSSVRRNQNNNQDLTGKPCLEPQVTTISGWFRFLPDTMGRRVSLTKRKKSRRKWSATRGPSETDRRSDLVVGPEDRPKDGNKLYEMNPSLASLWE